ncbi:putative cytosol aminopeptidase [Tilletiaria anomala UBC 951]|uniref:Putative cytosol aminopeptidase n=1 Tax=Tilletiaria anomala (strain ATCC 24038 / CBS 436.72 / UBC 951) TaxID=1037660 RepID=A0A066VWR2_TILAU|nr:putative cytosol aminopeptidase [Tilletiaria anomala UBC 951]KDN42980.1 putative cytosol aminopeptidase [Tilletiaria anomala UBC 951]
MSSSAASAPVDGVVIAIGQTGKPATQQQKYRVGDVSAQWAASRADSTKPGQLRVFHPFQASAPTVAAVSLGTQRAAPSTAPDALPKPQTFLRNEMLERTRLAAAKGARALRDLGAPSAGAEEKKDKKQPTKRTIAIDGMYSPHAAAVGANLSLFTFNHFKTRGAPEKAGFNVPVELKGGQEIAVVPLQEGNCNDEGDELKDVIAAGGDGGVPQLSWQTGEVYAQAQNWARELKETPANMMTPTIFAKRVVDAFKGLANTSVTVHDEDWARAKGMNVFLSVTAGTEQPAKFVEITYDGASSPDAPKLALVGKGVCFDSGGISLKPGAGMKLMRADMGGAASVVAVMRAIAELKLPINVVAATPLVENLPSGSATKPGDIIEAMNGLTVEVDNTDAEGRLILSDALTYISREYKPHTLLDVATLTGAILHALGHHYSGVFVEDESLWQELKAAGEAEKDLFWRMPLDDEYLRYIDSSNADLCNRGTPAGSACAAIFLKQFVDGLEDRSKLSANADEGKPTVRYGHIDIAGTMETKQPTDYQSSSMLTGRPTRALIEFARRFAVLHTGKQA